MPVLKLRSGKCRHQFEIKKNVTSLTDLDSLGRDNLTESVHATVKGELIKLSGGEKVLANQMFGDASHEFTCWYVPGVKNTMWLIGLNGKRFNIVDIVNVEERNRQLHFVLSSESS